MKKSLLPVFIFTVLIPFMFTANMNGQVTLPHYDGMDYTAGSALQTQTGWSSVNTGDDLVIATGSLFYTGLKNSLGNKVTFNGAGIDAYKSISTINSGTVYFSFILKVTNVSAATNTDGGYFAGVGQNTTTFGSTIWLKKNGENFNIGVNSRTSTTLTGYSSGTYNINTEIFIVASYTFNVSSGDDIAKIWINPSAATFGNGTEPIADITITNTAGTDLSSISSVFLRQDSEGETPYIELDELRISTAWADVTPSDVVAPTPKFVPANSAVDVSVNINPTITFDEPVRKTDGSELTNSDLSTLVIFKKTDASGDNVPFTAAIDAAKKVITVTPSASLSNSQAYYLAVGPVEDLAGNESTLKSATFTTISLLTPTVTVIHPNGGETFYSGDQATITWTTTNFDAGENVKIDVWLPESVWFTLEASTPNDGSQVVNVGPRADYGTTYKIRISGVTNGASDESDNPFTVIATTTTLDSLKTYYDLGSKIRYKGEAIITFIRTANRNQKYLQDATAGLLIDDASGVLTTSLAIGDKITNLEGTLGTYTGMFQLVPTVSTVTIVSSGNTVTAPTLTIPDYTANWAQYESMLIRIANITFPAADGSTTFAASTQYTVTDGTNDLAFFTFKAGEGNPSIVGTVIPSGTYAITGLALKFNTTIEISSRSTSDFESLSGIEKTSARDNIKLYPVPATSVLNVSGAANLKSVDILDVAGKVIRTINTSTEEVIRIPVTNLKRGTYMLRLNTTDGAVIKRFVR